MDRIEFYRTQVFPGVEGWVGNRMWQVLSAINSLHDKLGVYGCICEIGVHHGKFLFALNAIRRPNENIYGLDLFGLQHLNIDRSGHGSKEIVERHIAKLFPDEQEMFHLEEVDSMSVDPGHLRALFGGRSIRLFSIDGGHTAAHVCNDMGIAHEFLIPGGICAIDDFFGPHWPGVTEGVYRFMANSNNRLAPFLYFQNKLFFTTWPEHHLILSNFREFLDGIIGDEIHGIFWKYVDIFGRSVLSCAV